MNEAERRRRESHSKNKGAFDHDLSRPTRSANASPVL